MLMNACSSVPPTHSSSVFLRGANGSLRRDPCTTVGGAWKSAGGGARGAGSLAHSSLFCLYWQKCDWASSFLFAARYVACAGTTHIGHHVQHPATRRWRAQSDWEALGGETISTCPQRTDARRAQARAFARGTSKSCPRNAQIRHSVQILRRFLLGLQ